MRTRMRTSLLGALALGLATSAVTAPAQAANKPSRDAAGWLTGRLQDGLVVTTSEYGTYTSYGASLDVFFALEGLDVRSAARTRIIEAVEPNTDAYVGSGDESYAGPTGKLLTAVQEAGIDPSGFAAGDLLTRLQSRVRTEADAQQGRAVDQSTYGDYSNTLGQAWVVRALAGAADPLAQSAADFLVQQQCDTGFFREGMGDSTGSDPAAFSCDPATDEASVDATALAVLALRSARAAGISGLGDDIRDAVRWLRGAQRGNGSFVGNGVPNANSTGLAAWALSTSRWKGAAGTAAAWVAKLRVTPRRAAGTALEGEVGAVAYDKTAFKAAQEQGIRDVDEIQWILAGAQSAVALDALLPRTSLTVKAPARAERRDAVRVKVEGLAAGERWTLRRDGRKVSAGWANGKGVAVTKVRLPRTGEVRLTVKGSRGSRNGADVVRVR